MPTGKKPKRPKVEIPTPPDPPPSLQQRFVTRYRESGLTGTTVALIALALTLIGYIYFAGRWQGTVDEKLNNLHLQNAETNSQLKDIQKYFYRPPQ